MGSRNFWADIDLDRSKSPTGAVYIDATGHGHLGFVDYVNGEVKTWGMCHSNDRNDSQRLARKTQVNAYECIVLLMVVTKYGESWRNQQLVIYVDNNSALGALRKRSSPKADLNRKAGDFWVLAARHHLNVKLAGVTSKSNPADVPSRGEPPPRATESNRDAQFVLSLHSTHV